MGRRGPALDSCPSYASGVSISRPSPDNAGIHQFQLFDNPSTLRQPADPGKQSEIQKVLMPTGRARYGLSLSRNFGKCLETSRETASPGNYTMLTSLLELPAETTRCFCSSISVSLRTTSAFTTLLVHQTTRITLSKAIATFPKLPAVMSKTGKTFDQGKALTRITSTDPDGLSQLPELQSNNSPRLARPD